MLKCCSWKPTYIPINLTARTVIRPSKQTQKQAHCVCKIQPYSVHSLLHISANYLYNLSFCLCNIEEYVDIKGNQSMRYLCLSCFVHDVQRCLISLQFTLSLSSRWPFYVMVWYIGIMWQRNSCELPMNNFIHWAHALLHPSVCYSAAAIGSGETQHRSRDFPNCRYHSQIIGSKFEVSLKLFSCWKSTFQFSSLAQGTVTHWINTRVLFPS